MAEDEIPQKKVLNSDCNRVPKKMHSELQTAINMIRKLVKKCKKEIETRITEEEQIEIEQEIEKINWKQSQVL